MTVKRWRNDSVVIMLNIEDIRLLLAGNPSSKGVWLRAAVFLTRGVLEREVDRLWRVAFGGKGRTNRHTQFVCLKQLARDDRIDMDPVMAEDIHSAWASLSRACHHHEYDLTPTVPELELWIRQVERLVEHLRDNSEEK